MSKLTLAITALGVPALVGAQWTAQSTGTDAEFRGLTAVSPRVVWASGTKGRIARTIDGGVTWTVDTVSGATDLDFRDIAAVSATRAWAMSAGPAEQAQARIYRTGDGAVWERQFATTQQGVFPDAIKFWDQRNGIAMSDPVDGRLFLLTTADAGTTWTHLATDNAPRVLPGEAAFAASGTCLAVGGASNVWIATGGGARARVFRSSDRGVTWSVADTPVHARSSTSGIFSVAFTDGMHGVVVGGDYSKVALSTENVALTDDGGVSWRPAHGALPTGYMSAVAYIPETEGRSLVAVGLAGTARSIDGGESWLMIDTLPFNTVAFASPENGWAAGPGGRIAKWTPSTHGETKP